jgi:alpha-tubulin suppressor-like RCC1 family protein
LGLSLDEFDSFDTPREVFFFKEKIVSWLAAGTNHSLALTIEGYGYIWGGNDLGQLGMSNIIPVK